MCKKQYPDDGLKEPVRPFRAYVFELTKKFFSEKTK